MDQYWDKVAQNYKSSVLSPFHNEESTKKLSDILFSKKDSSYEQHILDAGCGRGYLLEILAQEFPSSVLVGVDNSQAMVEYAEQLSVYNASIHKKNMGFLPFKDETFHRIYAINSILFTSRKERYAALSELARVLNKNGTFTSVLPSGESFLQQMYTIKENLIIQENFSQEDAIRQMYIDAAARNYDPLGGQIDVDEQGTSRMKIYTQEEIVDTYSKNNLVVESIEKYSYPSSVLDEKNFVDGVYDWVVVARKQ